MRAFAQSSESERTLLLALFLALLAMLLFVFVTFKGRARRAMWFTNTAIFLGSFALFNVLCAEHNDISDGVFASPCFAVPIDTLWCAALLLFLYAVCGTAWKYRQRAARPDRGSIKEALDTMPAAICCFTEKGMVKLCNLQMYRLFYTLAQSDLQSLEELHHALDGCDSRTGVIRVSGDEPVYLFPDGRAWLFTEGEVRLADGVGYTESVFFDVTELYKKRLEMEAQTKKLKELGKSIRALSENVEAATREEETLSLKTALHDRTSAGLVAVRQVLLQDRPCAELDELIRDWKDSVFLVKQDNTSDKGALSELLRDAEAIGVDIRVDGELPPQGAALDAFLSAIRECLTNCVRHADGTELYVRVSGDADDDVITVTNNGNPPQEEIVPRGGLSNLKKRVEYIGGAVRIQSLPAFVLTVAIPKNRGTLR